MDGHTGMNRSGADKRPKVRHLTMSCPKGVLHSNQSREDGLMSDFRFVDNEGNVLATGARAKEVYRASRGYGPISGRIPDAPLPELAG